MSVLPRGVRRVHYGHYKCEGRSAKCEVSSKYSPPGAHFTLTSTFDLRTSNFHVSPAPRRPSRPLWPLQVRRSKCEVRSKFEVQPAGSALHTYFDLRPSNFELPCQSCPEASVASTMAITSAKVEVRSAK